MQEEMVRAKLQDLLRRLRLGNATGWTVSHGKSEKLGRVRNTYLRPKTTLMQEETCHGLLHRSCVSNPLHHVRCVQHVEKTMCVCNVEAPAR